MSSNQPPPSYTVTSPGTAAPPNNAAPAYLPGYGISPVYPYPRYAPSVYTSYLSCQSLGLGITQIIIGVLCFIFNIVAIAYGSGIDVVGCGIWSGIMFIITGSLGISAAKTRGKCQVIAFMVLSIISAVMTVPLLSIDVFGALYASSGGNDCYYDRYYYTCKNYTEVQIAMTSCLAILAFTEAVVCIWASVLGCKVACCCGSVPVVPMQYGPTPGPGPLLIAGHYGLGYGPQIIQGQYDFGQGPQVLQGQHGLGQGVSVFTITTPQPAAYPGYVGMPSGYQHQFNAMPNGYSGQSHITALPITQPGENQGSVAPPDSKQATDGRF